MITLFRQRHIYSVPRQTLKLTSTGQRWTNIAILTGGGGGSTRVADVESSIKWS